MTIKGLTDSVADIAIDLADMDTAIGEEEATASTGPVTASDSIMSYVKQLLNESRIRGSGLVIPFKVTTATSTTVFAADMLIGAWGNDAFPSPWGCYIFQADNAAPEGELRLVSDFVDNTGVVTVSVAYSAAPAVGDVGMLVHPSIAALGDTSTAAATGAVTSTDYMMAYIKQLVTEGISRDAVIGALNDAAAAGAVTNADTIMQYVKQLVTFAVAVGNTAMRGTDSAALASVLGALNDAAADGAVTDADTAVQYLKQLVTNQRAVVHTMPPFWSESVASLAVDATAGDESLPNVVVSDIPTGATVVICKMMFKYSKRVDSSSGANMTDAAQIMSIDSSGARDSVVTAIEIPTDSFHTASDATEGGDVIVGDNDVSAEVTGNATYYPTWELADMDADSLTFYDVQVGLQLGYTVE